MERNGVYGEEGAGVGLAAFFKGAQTRVEDFFHAAEFGAPQITHIVESAVDGVEAGVHMRREESDDKTEHGGVEHHRDADC